MSQVTPEPNGEPKRRRLTSDELIALFVAFTTLGSVIFWGFTRTGLDLNGPMGRLNPLNNGATIGSSSENATDKSRLGIGLGRTDTDTEFGLDDTDDKGSSADRLGLTTPNDTGDRTASQRNNSDRVGPAGGTVIPLPNPAGAGNTGLSELATGPDAGSNATGPDASSGNNADTDANDSTASNPNQANPPTNTELTEIEATREALGFTDVPDDYWAKPYIDALSSRQLIQGFDETTFKPEDPVNRAQLAALINQAFVLNAQKDPMAFTDLSEAAWAEAAIEEAVKGGFMTGFPDESFQPNLPVPRVQVMTALVTGLQTEASGDVDAVVERYSDKDTIPSWAVGKVAAATQSGLAVNYPELTELAPNQPATRAEVAAMIYQALSYQGRLDPIESEYVVQP